MNAHEDAQLEIASNDSSTGKRRSALVALRNMRSTKARPLFLELLQNDHSNQNLRETAIKALGEIGLADDIALLHAIALAEGDDPARFAKSAAKSAYLKLCKRFGRMPEGITPKAPSGISSSLPYRVFSRDGHKCASCGRGPNDGALLEADHIRPRSLGGSNDIDNLQTLCDRCNQGKSNRDSHDLRPK
jgi:HNH endonuclease/HEAT repeats